MKKKVWRKDWVKTGDHVNFIIISNIYYNEH